MTKGNCFERPPSEFFPSDGVGVEKARKVCDSCPVQSECLEYALRNRIDHGVWGGTSERQRRRILKARRLGAPSHHRLKPHPICVGWVTKRDVAWGSEGGCGLG